MKLYYVSSSAYSMRAMITPENYIGQPGVILYKKKQRARYVRDHFRNRDPELYFEVGIVNIPKDIVDRLPIGPQIKSTKGTELFFKYFIIPKSDFYSYARTR